MTDAAPNILYSIDEAGKPIAIIERRIEGGQQDVLAHYPGIIAGEFTLELAKLVNHFAREFKYEVIGDPAAFEAAYLERLNGEAKDVNWSQGATKLSDFGVPDFSTIKEPSFDGSNLIYYARSMRLGVPYEVKVAVNGTDIGEASYSPLPLEPVQ
jgi:hypothetical protein